MNAALVLDPFGETCTNPFAPVGVITVRDTSTPGTPSGTPHPSAVPPCAAKFPPTPATWKGRDTLSPSGPPPLRVSTTRHGAASGTYDAPPDGAKKPWMSTITCAAPPKFDIARSWTNTVFNGTVPVFVMPRPFV